MKKAINFQSREVILFKRWQNKPYSIFSTLGKLIIILSLPLSYLTLSYSSAYSQQDTVNIQEIQIKSQRKTVPIYENSKLTNLISKDKIDYSPANNLTDILDGTVGVDLQQRGVDNTQADLSIRGGNFDQTLVLLNGIPQTDVQTGHNVFSFPLPVEAISRIEVLQGPGSRLYGLGAYCGAINIVTAPPKKLGVMTNIEGGQFGLLGLGAYIESPLDKNLGLHYSGTFNSSDGYTTNTDYQSIGQFLSINYKKKNVSISSQFGYKNKKYGSYNFYTPKFPNQYETTSKLTAAVSIELGRKLRNKINLYYNRSYDEFHLFRESNGWYKHEGNFYIRNTTDTAKFAKNIYQDWAYYKAHNYHITNTIGFSFGSYADTWLGRTNYGFNIERNEIISTVLGEEIEPVLKNNIEYSKGKIRTNYNLFIDQSKQLGKFRLSAGVNVIYNEKFGFFTALGGDISYKISSHYLLYSSVNQGVRLPTFTDLYYSGPSNVGNSELKPEKATSYEIGHKYRHNNIEIQTAVFFRNGKNSIDWIKFKEEEKWHTLNYAKKNTFGFELSVNKIFNSRLVNYIGIDYTYLYQNKPESDIISRYSLNYLKHNFSITGNHTIIKNLQFSWRLKYSLRNGSYYYIDEITNKNTEKPFGNTWLLDARLQYQLKYLTLYVQASNILDVEYYDLSYIVLPGRWFKAGLKFKF